MLEVSWPALRVRSVSAFFGFELAVACYSFSVCCPPPPFRVEGLPPVLRATYQQQTSTFSGLGLATKHVLSGIGVSFNIGF